MAADLNPDWLSCLPSSWSYGVTRDGRVFFINEEAKSTTWLHPITGEAVVTGHRKTPDLPTGWEEGYTFEGARCFINCGRGHRHLRHHEPPIGGLACPPLTIPGERAAKPCRENACGKPLILL
ncbi:hypothetical protein AALO_G00221700 [Alosa alosa]|uniref:WW domain-containing protein n=1 Tax=Alosa alosa TaxID=278164 RepID=A0AAV6FXG6_9TELE|nr:hypothetical protein AALO_G00221700 [Alosa alosa]